MIWYTKSQVEDMFTAALNSPRFQSERNRENYKKAQPSYNKAFRKIIWEELSKALANSPQLANISGTGTANFNDETINRIMQQASIEIDKRGNDGFSGIQCGKALTVALNEVLQDKAAKITGLDRYQTTKVQTVFGELPVSRPNPALEAKKAEKTPPPPPPVKARKP